MDISYKKGWKSGSGVVSAVSWLNPQVKKALATLFDVSRGEVIVGLEVDATGIKAYFERLPSETD